VEEERAMSVKRYATLNFPGVMFPETETVAVTSGSKNEALLLFRAHPNCYRVDFFERTERTVDGEHFTGKGKAGKSYLCGEPFTLKQMEEMLDPDRHRILLNNVKHNHWKGAVRCPAGNWQPWEEDITVLAPASREST
jgi:hypothetical protein